MQGTERILQWLNGTRNYSDGVALYCAFGDDMQLKLSLVKGENEFSKKALVAAFEKMVRPPDATEVPKPAEASPELLAAVTEEAQKAWKQLMNERALLLSLCRNANSMAENAAADVQVRGKLALQILRFHKNTVLPAYDKLDYVRLYGQLPPARPDQLPDTDALIVPDHLLKQTIDNLRKNLGKMRKREATPERVALIEKHEANLKQLLQRWDSLT